MSVPATDLKLMSRGAYLYYLTYNRHGFSSSSDRELQNTLEMPLDHGCSRSVPPIVSVPATDLELMSRSASYRIFDL